ncbi:MAG: OmpA family protein, partial [Muribaculaceae bacterium]|nr:OmpA family protein [Muribaculaceae bacterium]
ANVLKSVAAEIKANPNTNYDVTGWADTWTGTDAINARLRTNRANAVVKQLVRNGVPAGQLNAKSGEGNRIDNRDQIYLDRAVTIEAVK